jgi:hypothetical protein
MARCQQTSAKQDQYAALYNERVMAMKEVTMTTPIPSNLEVVEECQWSTYLHEIRGNYYNDI